MNTKSRQSIALLAALCWIFAQNISLDHQYSSEHLSQTDSHICLSFANDNDDLAIDVQQDLNFINSESLLLAELSIGMTCQPKAKYKARAPPKLLS